MYYVSYKDKAKKSLHQQYADLQQQFSRWQQQLMDNQKILSDNNMISQGIDNLVMPPPPPPDSIYQNIDKTHQNIDKTHQNTDRTHQNTDRTQQNMDRTHQNTDRTHQNTDRTHQNTDRTHQNTEKTYQNTEKTYQSTEKTYQNTDSTYQNSVSEDQRKAQALAVENYRRLSTPRPFGHRSSDTQFKPRPIMRKAASFDQQTSSDAASGLSYSTSDVGTRQVIIPHAVHTEEHVPPVEPVSHKILTTSQSFTDSIPPPPHTVPPANNVKTRPRLIPRLDPREELMLAIRSAGGRRILAKVNLM